MIIFIPFYSTLVKKKKHFPTSHGKLIECASNNLALKYEGEFWGRKVLTRLSLRTRSTLTSLIVLAKLDLDFGFKKKLSKMLAIHISAFLARLSLY